MKIYKWKLLHRTLPNIILLSTWKISSNSLCKVCHVAEDYNHYFIECAFYEDLWKYVQLKLGQFYFGKNF